MKIPGVGIFLLFCLFSLLLFSSSACADLNCIGCHGPTGPHEEGFEGCNICHGYPPLTSQLGVDGLVKYPAPTGGTSPGAHAKHATASGYSYPCRTCHSNGMTAGGGIVQDPRRLELGFSILGAIGGAYDGRILQAPLSYAAGNGTTITANGSMTCSNIYCHSNGTSVTTQAIPPATSPAWTFEGPLACDSCHGYPPAYTHDNPKANLHIEHQFGPCNSCHYATTNDGIHITDKTKHINGVYDVAADPAVGANITYVWDRGGGTCSNVICHFNDQNFTHAQGEHIRWGAESTTFDIIGVRGDRCYELIFSVVLPQGNTLRLPGVSYLWDFGDGRTSTEVAPRHTYSSAGPHTVHLDLRDADHHPASRTQNFTAFATSNVQPVADKSLSVSDYTVTLTDLSYDPDFNTCGHSGPGSININWGGGLGSTVGTINLTDSPSNQGYTFTYPRAGTFTIIHSVTDNANPPGTKISARTDIIVPAPANSINISGRVTHFDTGAPAVDKMMALRKNGVKYLIATTDYQGYYRFVNVPPGCYTVQQFYNTGYSWNPAISQEVCTNATDVNFTITPL